MNDGLVREGSCGYFDSVAEEWDKMRSDFFSEKIREEAVKKSGIRSGNSAADIGAGTGFITEELLRNGIAVTAVDQSDEMLSIIQEKYPNVAAVKGSGENLPIVDGSVDYAFANMYLHHVEEPAKAIQEMTRIIKSGGKVVITDLDTHDFEFLKTEQYDRWMGFDRNDIKKWFENAGLKNIKIECTGEECCADSACGCTSAKISVFIAYGEK